MKNNIKIITAFILGILISGGVVYAAGVIATQISYDNSESNLKATTVQEAIDEVYNNLLNPTGSAVKVNYKAYLNDELSEDLFSRNDLYLSNYTCENDSKASYDRINKKLLFNDVGGNDNCDLYFYTVTSDKVNLNTSYRKSYTANGDADGCVPINAIDGRMDSGRGYHWYGGTKLLVEYNGKSLIETIGVYTSDNWGYSFKNATIYYSSDDSLTLDSDLTNYPHVTVSTEADRDLSKSIIAKRVLLVKNTNEAVYEFKALGYSLNN